MQSDETVPIDSADNALPLPDIKQALRRKAMEEELARVEEEKESTKVKIKRTDRVAMARVCTSGFVWVLSTCCHISWITSLAA
jgi:hypothetical protein